MKRYICIHGHFYQPPRENPWLESIEIQDSAAPFHDWNERITAECYGPNARARILDGAGRIRQIVNNYARISFNFGPTLLSWMEETHPQVYEAILEADRESMGLFAGHGSAIAQVYNHVIMPLANERDKRTQVGWGVADFAARFGRDPEGMWLAETAVDVATLEALAAEGIRYTILAPYQAKQIRALDGGSWLPLHPGQINPRQPYVAHLPSGRSINLFFYDGGVSQAVAFERLLVNGEGFAKRLFQAFGPQQEGLVHIATDGETYGHHHRFGEMALAYALATIEASEVAELINYGAYLDLHPPDMEVEIVENTAWSCAHGVERWRSDCGCHGGGQPGWNQRWRKPLRDALDWLRDQTIQQYEEHAPALLQDPEAARDAYIDIILHRDQESLDSFFAQHVYDHVPRPLTRAQQNSLLKLLEVQRNAMLMYTSCGWFFDEISGIETNQILQYAGRVLQLSRTISKAYNDWEARFLKLLAKAPSNLPQLANGKGVYLKYAHPAQVDFPKLTAHYAAMSLFSDIRQKKRIYVFDVQELHYQLEEREGARLLVGQLKMSSRITRGEATMSFAMLHLGGHALYGGVRPFSPKRDEGRFRTLTKALQVPFLAGNTEAVHQEMKDAFGEERYSMKTLFRDQQREVLDQVMDQAMTQAQTMARQLYDEHAPLIRFLAGLEFPIPDALKSPTSFVLRTGLHEALSTTPLPIERIHTLLLEVEGSGLSIDTEGLGFAMQQTIEALAETWRAAPSQLASLEALTQAATLIDRLPFDVHMHHVQNIYFRQRHLSLIEEQERAAQGDKKAAQWLAQFAALGEALHFHLDG